MGNDNSDDDNDSYGKKVKDCNDYLDDINKNIKESAYLYNSYKYGLDYGRKKGGTLESYYNGQKEGEQKARDCFK